ncbi:MAG TPA: hypothetical protein VLS94_12715, partial [Fusibacter sp.]|nr:hypothetical protein [Fusibacter sp.]
LLGWNRAKNENKPDEGLFGDLDAWSYAVEEQGRKTLHAHFLLWVRRWKELLDGLARADGGRLYFEDALCFYGSKNNVNGYAWC